MVTRVVVLVVVIGSIGAAAITRDQPWRDRTVVAPLPTQPVPDPAKDAVYICPMDPDVRSRHPGTCSRCGMNLVSGIPDPVEFHLDLSVAPQPLRPEQPSLLAFAVHDPWKNRPVSRFLVVHEKLFHAFVVSQDLEFFQHGHPRFSGNGIFKYSVTFPHGGMFRILGDFYPDGATPQLLAQTVLVPGEAPPPAVLVRDYSMKTGTNLAVSLETSPPLAVAGERTQLNFTMNTGDGLEKYLGAWGHMLAASDDLIDMMHEHPRLADGSASAMFEIVFPRAGTYRVWVQFQRRGVVNTVHFDVPVRSLEDEGNP